MHKLLLVVALLAVLAVPAMADDSPRSIVGAKLDAPNLVRFTPNLTLGLEGGKDMYTNVMQDSGRWIEDDKGFFGYVKLTYTGSLLNFSK